MKRQGILAGLYTRVLQGSALVELGAKSGKVHFIDLGRLLTRKYPNLGLGREVYSRGEIPESKADAIVDVLISLRAEEHMLLLAVVGTGGLRDARNRRSFLREVRRRSGVEVRILSGKEEASLAARAFLRNSPTQFPAFICDLGGGSLDWAYIDSEGESRRGSERLGAIRLSNLGRAKGGGWDEKSVENEIRSRLTRSVSIASEEVIGMGGTFRAITKVVGRHAFSRDEVARLVAKTRRDGPPRELDPRRADVFLPGILAVLLLMDHVGARSGRYLGDITIGHVLLEDLLLEGMLQGMEARR